MPHSLLRSNVIASTIAAREPSFINKVFHVEKDGLVQILEFRCVYGTKKNFEKGTIVF